MFRSSTKYSIAISSLARTSHAVEQHYTIMAAGRHARKFLSLSDVAREGVIQRSELQLALLGIDCERRVPFSCYDPSYTSQAPLPTCDESCWLCAPQYLPVNLIEAPAVRISMTKHNDAIAAETARVFVESTKADLSYIRRAR